jgi:hypothetical protein
MMKPKMVTKPTLRPYNARVAAGFSVEAKTEFLQA